MRTALLPFTVAIALAAAFFSCKATEPQPDAAPAATVVAAPSASTAAAPCVAQEALDRMDTRTGVPLLPMMANHQKQNMRDHLAAVQEIVAGLGAADFAAIEKSASRIGYSEQMGAMCTHMGAGAPGFTEKAIAFHKTADGIAAAAKRKDRDAVLSALAATLSTCTGCHSTWKQQVVDDATWTKATSQAPPTHPMHGGAMHAP